MNQLKVMTFLMTAESHSTEWERAWGELAQLNGGDPVGLCFETGEQWQYICTSHTEDGWMHYFRHRRHPQSQRRESVLIPCSPECVPKVT